MLPTALSLRTKLLGTIGLSLAGLAALAVTAWIFIVQEAHELGDMGREDMPMAVLATELGGNLMDQDIEYQRVLRSSYAMVAGAPEAVDFLNEGRTEFDRLVGTSEAAFKRLRALIEKAEGDEDDPKVAAIYRRFGEMLDAIDAQQAAYVGQVREVTSLVAAGSHREAMTLNQQVRKTRAQAEASIAAFHDELTALTEANVVAALAAADRAGIAMVALSLLAGAALMAAGVSLTRSVLHGVGGATQAARRIADGDLTTPLQARSSDEIGQLVQAMADMQASLKGLVGTVRGNADSVATASGEIAQGNLDLSRRTEQQASALQQTAASMEQLGTAVRQNADHAAQADRLAQGACDVAIRGGEVVGRVVTTMQGINDSSSRIAEIIGTIDSIAFQTNILALNAAVEAARAGEQGRGFAVVAAEVRSLAQRSAQAAAEIKGLITTSVERVGEGAALVGQAGTTMDEIVAAIRRVTTIVGEISGASSQQSDGVAQVGQAVTQMDQATQQNAALVEQSAAAADSLNLQARQLVDAVSKFRLAA